MPEFYIVRSADADDDFTTDLDDNGNRVVYATLAEAEERAEQWRSMSVGIEVIVTTVQIDPS